jgi:uncharacterized protein YneF (UPF0154 family)
MLSISYPLLALLLFVACLIGGAGGAWLATKECRRVILEELEPLDRPRGATRIREVV